MEELKVVGKDIPRLDAVEKVTGKAKFAADFKISGVLYAKILGSPHPHARIVSIDTSKAESLAGVRAVVTPKDVPPVSIDHFLGDQYVLCLDNVVRYVGDPLAAVAADTAEIAEKALRLIEIDYEELPAVFDAEEAFRTGPPVVIHPDLPKYKRGYRSMRLDPERPNVCQHYKIRSGDVEKGFQEADLVVENRFSTIRIQHCPLEPHLAEAWFEPDGSLTLRSTHQSPHSIKLLLGKLFNLSPSKIRVLSPYLGGTFGCKSGSPKIEAIAVLLAQKSGRPVRLAFTREDVFVIFHRAPLIMYIKDGVKSDGTLIAREIRAILGLGAYNEHGVHLTVRSAAGAVGTYRIPNFKLDAYGVYTNLALTGPFRGYASEETQWAIEQQMDIIAEKLGIDPVEIRKKNILNKGDRDVCGWVTNSIGVGECLDKVAGWIGWGEKPAQEEGSWRRGKGIAIGNKSVGHGLTSVVFVKVWQDGMIEVRHSAIELGQGINTTLAQIAAEQFEVSIERVKVVSGDTAFCPYYLGTVASTGLITNGNALIFACQDAKQQLFKMAVPKLGAAPEDLATSEGKIYVKGSPEKSIGITDLFTPLGMPLGGVEILGRGSYTGPVIRADPETGQSEKPGFDYSHVAHAAEVAVDLGTGEVKVLRRGIACDVGRVINPKVIEGQMEGSVGMGIGEALFEEIVLDEGAVDNANFREYHIPTTVDIPSVENSKSMIVEAGGSEGPLEAKGAGELPLIGAAPVIANAVYNAVGARIKDLPLSKEKVLGGIRNARKC